MFKLYLVTACLLAIAWAIEEDYKYCGTLLNAQLTAQRERQVLVPPSNPVTVRASIMVVMVKGIEDEEERLTMTILLSMQWDDHRITVPDLDCTKKSSKFVLEATKYLPWYPHVTIANSADTVLYEEGWRFFPSLLFANGTVKWIQEYQLKTICVLNLILFPFDTQFCTIEIESPHYNMDVINFEVEDANHPVQLVAETAAQAPVWKLVGQTWSKIEHTPGIEFKLALQRRPSFYICSLMLPTLVINIMTAATFILSPVFDEKPQCAQSCLLAYILLNLVFYTYVPASSNSQPFLVAFFALQNFLGLACFFAVCWMFRREHFLRKREENRNAQNALTPEDQELEEEGLFDDPQQMNDFAFMGYIAAVVSTYIATISFVMLGSINESARAIADGYLEPKVGELLPSD